MTYKENGAPDTGPTRDMNGKSHAQDTKLREIFNARNDESNTQQLLTRPVLSKEVTLDELAKLLGINKVSLDELGIRELTKYRRTRLEVPLADRDGENRGAWTLKNMPERDGSYRLVLSGPKGSNLPMGLPSLDNLYADGSVYLCPDLPTVIALWYLGYPTIHLEPRTTIPDEICEELDKADRIIIVSGPERMDRRHFEIVRKIGLMESAECGLIPAPREGEDGDHVSEVAYLTEQLEVLRAEPLTDVYSRWKRAQRERLAPMCKDLLEEKSLLSCFERDLGRGGFAGDTKTAKIVFLAMISRLLAKPVSLAIKSVSSAGKSFTVTRTSKFFPDDAIVTLSAMSEKALIRSGLDLRHKILLVSEAEGVSGGFLAYVIRLLLSEDRVEYGTLVEQQGDWKGQRFTVEGPTSFMTTTTMLKLHPENETRLLSITTDETPEQTARIMRTIAQGSGFEVDYSRWHTLHRYMELLDAKVDIPYAKNIADNIPPVATRLRRDITAILSLVRSHTLLHAGSREWDEDGRLIATLEDYKAVYDLTHQLFAEGVEQAIPEPVRRLVIAVQEINNDVQPPLYERKAATYDELTEVLGLHISNVSRNARAAIELGYVVDLRMNGGRECELYATPKLSDDRALLPSPEEVSRAWNEEQNRE